LNIFCVDYDLTVLR